LKNIDIQSDPQIRDKYISIIKNPKYLNCKETFYLAQIKCIIDAYTNFSNQWAALEIGFGEGNYLKALSDYYKYATFSGIEVSEERVNNMRQAGYNCELVKGEEYPDINIGKFDVIYGFAVLHHISEPYTYLQKCWDLLKPGGILIFMNEAHILDLTALIYVIFRGSWSVEKNLLKLSKHKIIKTLSSLSSNFYVKYDGMIWLAGFPTLNLLYRRLLLHRAPLMNALTIFAQKV
jgi:SAM-dependent methyltransferase